MTSRTIRLGYLCASVDGALLACWGAACVWLAEFSPTLSIYGTVLLVAGIFHIVGGYAIGRRAKVPPAWSLRSAKLPLLFGAIAVVQYALGIAVYEDAEADLATSSFLRNSSLIFLAIIAHVISLSNATAERKGSAPSPLGEQLTWRKLAGLLLFVAASWCFCGFPIQDLQRFTAPWIGLSLAIGLGRALTELLMQFFAKTTNFQTVSLWTGMVLLLSGSVGILWDTERKLPEPAAILPIILVSGIIPLMQIARYQALSFLREILAKKGVTIAAYMLTAVLLGFAVGDVAHNGKFLGLILALPAVVLLDTDTYRDLRKFFASRLPTRA